MTPISSSGERGRILALAIGLPVFFAPCPAWAEPSTSDYAQARELLNEGLDLRDAGDVRAALDKIQASNALAHTPITALELGCTYATLGRLVEARETLLSLARLEVRPEETERSKAARVQAEQLADALRARIPSLTVRITGIAPESAAVTLDGTDLPPQALIGHRLVDPGHHGVSARAPNGAIVEAEVLLAEGEERTIELAFPHAEAPPPAPPAAVSADHARPIAVESRRAPPSHALEAALIGSGVAIGIAGTALMAVEVGEGQAAANRRDRGAYDAAKIGWIAGLAGEVLAGGLVVGGIMLFARPGPRASGAPVSVRLSASLNHWSVEGAW
jgi:hypothetical protein